MTSDFEPIFKGKTKTVWPRPGSDGKETIVESNDAFWKKNCSAGKEIPGIGALRTEQTANLFEFLSRIVPTAFVDRGDKPNAFIAKKLDMIPLRIVMRRMVAHDSYYPWRHPEFLGRAGFRFDSPTYELFYTNVVVVSVNSGKADVMNENLLGERYFKDDKGQRWEEADGTKSRVKVYPSAIAYLGSEADETSRNLHLYSRRKPARDCARPIAILRNAYDYSPVRDNIAAPAFRAIELAWETVPTCHLFESRFVLADIKFEVGRDKDGKVLLGDVVDNDCWRILMDGDPNKDYSKQLFKKGAPDEDILSAYKSVAELTRNFTKPEVIDAVKEKLGREYDPDSGKTIALRDHSIWRGR